MNSVIVVFLGILVVLVVVSALVSPTPPSLVIRVCDGPSCSSQGSDQLFDAFCKQQEKYLKEVGIPSSSSSSPSLSSSS